MTIVESIKCVLQQNNDGLTSKQIYDEIIRQGLYSFGAENPVGVVNAQLRRRCIGLDFPTAYPIKFFEIAGYEGKKIKFRLISTENTATIITAPKTTDISELLPEEKIKAALQEHLQNIRQQVFDSVLNNSPEFFEHLVVDLLLKMGYVLQGGERMKHKLLKDLYDCFYTPPELSAQKQEIEECHRALSGVLGKSERRLVLQIIDAKDRIAEDTSIDSFIAGFELAWKLSIELNHYENERSVSRRTAMGLGARFASKGEEK